jgi:hypothetical protein
VIDFAFRQSVELLPNSDFTARGFESTPIGCVALMGDPYLTTGFLIVVPIAARCCMQLRN